MMKRPSGPLQSPGPRNNSSPAARREDRQRAETAGLQLLEQQAKVRREKTARLKKLREDRDSKEGS
jgi:hypothetical protein